MLLVYGAGLLLASDRYTVPTAIVATTLDVAWVVLSVLILLADTFQFSTTGNVTILLIAFAVADFAIFQTIGFRRVSES